MKAAGGVCSARGQEGKEEVINEEQLKHRLDVHERALKAILELMLRDEMWDSETIVDQLKQLKASRLADEQ